jgi:hypothetical protein
MTKTNLDQPSRHSYARPPSGATTKPHDEVQHQLRQEEPEICSSKSKPTLPKDEPDLPQTPRPPPSIPTSGPSLREYLTRRQAAEFVRDQLGRPMAFSTASKLAALGEFAEPAIWGRRPLYTRDDLRAWAEARSRPTKESAVSEGTQRVTDQTEMEAGAQRGSRSEGCNRYLRCDDEHAANFADGTQQPRPKTYAERNEP